MDPAIQNLLLGALCGIALSALCRAVAGRSPIVRDKVVSLLQSRRAWTLVGAVIVEFLQEELQLDPETAHAIAAALIAWVLGDSLRRTEKSK